MQTRLVERFDKPFKPFLDGLEKFLRTLWLYSVCNMTWRGSRERTLVDALRFIDIETVSHWFYPKLVALFKQMKRKEKRCASELSKLRKCVEPTNIWFLSSFWVLIHFAWGIQTDCFLILFSKLKVSCLDGFHVSSSYIKKCLASSSFKFPSWWYSVNFWMFFFSSTPVSKKKSLGECSANIFNK